MSDLFQPGVPDDYIEAVVCVMVEANWHTYQVLTKRSDRLKELLSGKLRFAALHRHIWWGVSVEDKRYGLPRVDDLRSAPAAVRFLSIEPLLEELGDFDPSGIHWAIVGGESGRGAQPMALRELVITRLPRWGVPFKDIAGVIGRRLNVPVVSKAADEANDHFGWFAMFAGRDVPASSQRTRELLGWQPKKRGLIADIDHRRYFKA